MARQRDPRREEAFQIWKESKGAIKLKDIAKQLGVADTQIRKWKSQDKWEPSKGNVTNSKRNVTNPKAQKEVVVEAEGLTEKQKLFCIYYIKSFNQTMAAIKAGYSSERAHITGSELVRNSKVAEEIRRLKGEMRKGLFIDAMDILDKYIRIAFADLTDFITFNEIESTAEETVKEYDDKGNVITETTRTEPYTYTSFRMRKSDQVDGTLMTELSKGKDGMFKVKLADKMKALDMLAKYFDLLSEKDQKKLQDEKLKVEIAKTKAEITRIEGDSDNEDDAIDDWVEAVTADE